MNYKKTLLLLVVLFVSVENAGAQTPQRGLTVNAERAYPGFTLFAPLGNDETHLINMEGKVVHSWRSNHKPANSAFILPSGDLLRCSKFMDNQRFGNGGPSGGRVERFSWNGELLWDYVFSDDRQHHHHDIEPLPDGNVLLIAWHYISAEDAIAAGRDPASVSDEGIFPDKIVEVKQTGPREGEVVWQWNSWDHLIQDFDKSKDNFGKVAEHPELIDVNLNPRPRTDWMHSNSVAYNPRLDQIILSVRSFGEFFVIDHSTTTEEAAGHTGGRAGSGGDLLYRWGNPANYRAGTAEDRQLFGQHDARWVDDGYPGAGNITVFNNGSQRPGGEYSSVDELVPPLSSSGTYERVSDEAFGPQAPIWSYTAEDKFEFYSSFISGAERLPNGNTLICAGALGEFIEVTPDKEIVWKYLNPFRSEPEPAGRGDGQERPGGQERAGGQGRQRGPGGPPPPPGRGTGQGRGTTGGPPAGRARGGSPRSPHIVFRVERYPADYRALADRGLKLHEK